MDFPQVQAIKCHILEDIKSADINVKALDNQIAQLIRDREAYLANRMRYYRQVELIDQVIDLVNQQLESTEDLADNLDGDSDSIEIPDTSYLLDCDW